MKELVQNKLWERIEVNISVETDAKLRLKLALSENGSRGNIES